MKLGATLLSAIEDVLQCRLNGQDNFYHRKLMDALCSLTELGLCGMQPLLWNIRGKINQRLTR
jgi:hypothetical protein